MGKAIRTSYVSSMVVETSWITLHVICEHYALVVAGGDVVVVSVKLCCQESELRASREVGSLNLMRMILVLVDLGLTNLVYMNPKR